MFRQRSRPSPNQVSVTAVVLLHHHKVTVHTPIECDWSHHSRHTDRWRKCRLLGHIKLQPRHLRPQTTNWLHTSRPIPHIRHPVERKARAPVHHRATRVFNSLKYCRSPSRTATVRSLSPHHLIPIRSVRHSKTLLRTCHCPHRTECDRHTLRERRCKLRVVVTAVAARLSRRIAQLQHCRLRHRHSRRHHSITHIRPLQ